MEIDPNNLSSGLKDGPLAAIANLDNVPEQDRLCRSMAAPGIVATDATTNAFSVLCGGGAHGDSGGDFWIFSFLSNSNAGGASKGKAPAVAPQPTFCAEKEPKEKGKKKDANNAGGLHQTSTLVVAVVMFAVACMYRA